ncbi:sensor histidine kinase [Amycolatopsis pigmentata]|uniref:histidine kinase n=1 Tax=Amycolatopsis pigmentata TaxID=450801 RepID=A0ABW5GAA3_9PSEU
MVFRGGRTVTPWAIGVAGMLLTMNAPVSGVWAQTGALCQLTLLNLVSARRHRVAALATVVTFLAMCVALSPQPEFHFLGAGGMTVAGWTLGSAGLGAVVRIRREYAMTVEARARWALETREAEASRRVAEERLRIAREVHDVLGHHVAVIRVHAGLARRSFRAAPDRAATALRETEAAAKAVMREMPGILRLLRDTANAEPPSPLPKLEEIDALLETARGAGLDVVLDREVDAERVSQLVAVTAYRLVQECLTNARRHGTGPLELVVRTGPATLTLVASNAVAATPPRREGGGHGLVGMRERVHAVGGRLAISSGGGVFRLMAELPLEAGTDLAEDGRHG